MSEDLERVSSEQDTIKLPDEIMEPVTMIDIMVGQPRTSDVCPMNLAVRRALVRLGYDWATDQERVEMWKQKLRIYPPDETEVIEYRPSRVAQRFAREFDEGYDVEPFVFEAWRI